MAYQGQPYDPSQAYGQQYQGQPYPQQQNYNQPSGQGQYGQPPQQQGQWPQQQPQHQHGHNQPLPPPPGQGQGGLQGDHGSFPGGSYSITHRDTNAVLTLDIAQGSTIKAKPGAMIHMAGTIQLTGRINFSMRKMFTGGQMAESTYAGHGKVALAPTLFGDIVTLQIDQNSHWLMGKDAYLASTADVQKETKSQGFGKALFSGEDLFVYRLMGQGLVWLTSYGAVDRVDLKPGENYIVDNGHLVAWNTEYKIEKAGGGAMTSMKTGEGLVCRFVGPGTVYIQTRNLGEFASWVREAAGPRQ